MYKKYPSQIRLEQMLTTLNQNNITVSKLKENPESTVNELMANNCPEAMESDCSKRNTDFGWKEFGDTLAEIIYELVHENDIRSLITSVGKSGVSMLQENGELDTVTETINKTYVGLMSVLTKYGNKGRVRIDTYQDNAPEVFVYKLRKYIENNIIPHYLSLTNTGGKAS